MKGRGFCDLLWIALHQLDSLEKAPSNSSTFAILSWWEIITHHLNFYRVFLQVFELPPIF